MSQSDNLRISPENTAGERGDLVEGGGIVVAGIVDGKGKGARSVGGGGHRFDEEGRGEGWG